MRFSTTLNALPLLAATLLYSGAAEARDQIRAVGSSTVFPFTSAAAEQFGQAGKFKTPIVESTGTGGGFKLFCAGVGEATPDITGASRPITDSEKQSCATNGVTYTEVPIGYDGIVIASAKDGKQLSLSKKQIFQALAAKLPDSTGALVPNPNKKWSDIDASLPASAIEAYGPPPTSGTRDAFVELVMDEGCKAFPEFAKAIPDEKERKKACHLMREDGGFIEAGEDDNVIVQKLTSNKNAVGIFGYSFLVENMSKVQASIIDGIAPTEQTIEDGSYKVARSLFIYVKNEHVGKIPGIAEFANQFVGKDAVGKGGYLLAKGLLPLHADMQKTAQERAASITAGK